MPKTLPWYWLHRAYGGPSPSLWSSFGLLSSSYLNMVQDCGRNVDWTEGLNAGQSWDWTLGNDFRAASLAGVVGKAREEEMYKRCGSLPG